MNSEKFKPGAGANQAMVRFGGGPQLGQTTQLGQMGSSPISQAPINRNTVGGPPPGVKGAQPIRLLGQPVALGAQMGSAPQMTAAPRQALGHSGGGNQVHRIAVIGLGSDGRKYVARFEAEFPSGTTIQDVREE